MNKKIKILTIFPEIFDSFLQTGLILKALQKGIVNIERINIRNFSRESHQKVDDYPYGGGAGMLMMVQPVVEAIESAGEGKKILLSPSGILLTQKIVHILSMEESLIIVCGRYEGIDERVRFFVDTELSIGDFVLHGGEVAAMALIESIIRLYPQFMGNEQSLNEESHSSGILEYPQYTRPRSFRGLDVPEVLLSGDHEKIKRWRRTQALLKTKSLRPDLWEKIHLSDEDKKLIEHLEKNNEQTGRDE